MSSFMNFRLDGKVALVTGSSRGLGQAIAEGLAEAGATIVGIARGDQTETEEKVKRHGVGFKALKVDLLENLDNLEGVFRDAVEAFGKVDILVNNAGTTRRKSALELTEEDWDVVMNLNLKVVFLLSQLFARHVIARKTRGRIINIASMQSFQGGILIAPYTASKHGVLGLTKALANEWAKYGINVNAVAPGYMRTHLTAPLREDKIRNQEILSRIPMGRWGEPEDLKGVVVFLASELSDYITGTVITVDGGWMSR